MRATIVLNMDNAAFEDAPGIELARILRKLADDVENNGPENANDRLHDINGNSIGEFRFFS